MHTEAPNRTSLIINRFKRKASQQILNKQGHNVLHERVNAFCSDQFPGDGNQGKSTLSLCERGEYRKWWPGWKTWIVYAYVKCWCQSVWSRQPPTLLENAFRSKQRKRNEGHFKNSWHPVENDSTPNTSQRPPLFPPFPTAPTPRPELSMNTRFLFFYSSCIPKGLLRSLSTICLKTLPLIACKTLLIIFGFRNIFYICYIFLYFYLLHCITRKLQTFLRSCSFILFVIKKNFRNYLLYIFIIA